MWCGGVQYCWHSQLESCIGSALRSDCRREGPLFIRHFFLCFILTYVHVIIFFTSFHLSLFYPYFNPLLAASFFFLHIILSVAYFKPFPLSCFSSTIFWMLCTSRINTFWWSHQISFNAFYLIMEQNQLPKRDFFFFCRKQGDGKCLT